jgi:hypothetical protein
MAELLQTLHAAKADGTYRTTFRRVTGPDLLILDDAGFADLQRDAANERFRVVCARYKARYKARSTVVVSNLPFKQRAEFLPSPRRSPSPIGSSTTPPSSASPASPIASLAMSTGRRSMASSAASLRVVSRRV